MARISRDRRPCRLGHRGHRLLECLLGQTVEQLVQDEVSRRQPLRVDEKTHKVRSEILDRVPLVVEGPRGQTKAAHHVTDPDLLQPRPHRISVEQLRASLQQPTTCFGAGGARLPPRCHAPGS